MKEKRLFKINSLDLTQDIVLVDFIYPVLFTCTDNCGHIYIVACYLADSNTREWLIADTDPEKVISLLQNKISIRDMFLGTRLWQAVLKADGVTPTIKQVNAEELDPQILPTKGEYMDADPGEFEEEIRYLRNCITDIYGEPVSGENTVFAFDTFSVEIWSKFYTLMSVDYGAKSSERCVASVSV